MYLTNYISDMNEDTRTCLLARVRHKVEANNQTIRMLIIRLVGDIGVEGCKDILLNNNGKPLFNGQELFEDFETYCNTHDIANPEKQIGKKISEDVENRTEIINNLKGRFKELTELNRNLEDNFNSLSTLTNNTRDHTTLEKNIERNLNIHISTVHKDEIEPIVDDLNREGFFYRAAQHFTYDSATDLGHYSPALQLADWSGRQMIWNTKNDGGEIKLLWTEDFKNIWNNKKSNTTSKIIKTARQFSWATFKSTWNLMKIPLAPVGGVLRLSTRALDSTTHALFEGTLKPYKIIKPPRTYHSPENTSKNMELNVVSCNMERFVAIVAKTTGKEVTTPAADTKKNVTAIKRYLKTSSGKNAPDVICLQEMFDVGAQDVVVEGLRKEYPYMVRDIGKKHWPFMGSGLMVLSKHPIADVAYHRFSNALGDESLANKGVCIARIRKNGKLIDIANTHTQAGSSLGKYKRFFQNRQRGAGSTSHRRSVQMGVIAKLLKRWSKKETNGQQPFARVLCGDTNDSINHADEAYGMSSMNGVKNRRYNSKLLGVVEHQGITQISTLFNDRVSMPKNFMDVKPRFGPQGIILANTSLQKNPIECVKMNDKWMARVVDDNLKVKRVPLMDLLERGYWLTSKNLKKPEQGQKSSFVMEFRAKNGKNKTDFQVSLNTEQSGWFVEAEGQTHPLDNFKFTNQENYTFSGYSGLNNSIIDMQPKLLKISPIQDKLFHVAREYNNQLKNGSVAGRKYRHSKKNTGKGGEGTQVLLDRVLATTNAPGVTVEEDIQIVDAQTFAGLESSNARGRSDAYSPDHHAVRGNFVFKAKAKSIGERIRNQGGKKVMPNTANIRKFTRKTSGRNI